MSAGYTDYGYDSADANWSDSYLLAPLKALLGQPRCPILDVGCGNGGIARALIAGGYDVYGIDASRSGIEIASKAVPGRFFLHDINESTLPKELDAIEFGVVISTEVIQHLYAPRRLLGLARKQLGSDGVFIVSTAYHGYLKNVALAISGKLDDHFGALWDGGFIKFFSRRTLERMLRDQGFEVVEFMGAGRFPLFWKSMFIKARPA